MAEQLVNELTVNRPIAEAWAVITDVERIAPCLPGAQLQEIEGDVYRGVVKVKLGAITPEFRGQATFLEQDDAAHRAVIKAEGRDVKGRGNAAAEITAQAESLSPTSTKVVVTTELAVTGTVARFGRNVMGDVSKRLMNEFANNLNEMLDEQPAAATTVDADAAGSPPGDANDAPAVGEAATSALGADVPTSDADGAAVDDGTIAGESAATPRIRRIDSPATEPIDLAGLAGPVILKRLAPVLGALLLVLFLVRRRR